MRTSKLVAAAAALAVIALLGVFVIGLMIGSGVRDASTAAVAEFGGDRVQALIAVVDSPTHSLAQRNRAVWALGQLGDARALPALERHRTGAPCDHAHQICQYEIDKAIRACRGSTNLTAFLWR
ncbi:MAG TPA: hypothetical protein VF147_12830 [Vicinamibacterales bacterium]